MEFTKNGFVRVGAAIPTVHIGNPMKNVEEMLLLAKKADEQNISILGFPELGITGYSCGDFFGQQFLHRSTVDALSHFLSETRNYDTIYIVGLPLSLSDQLFNVAAICARGEILAFVPKTYIPNYKEFYELRWFKPARALKPRTITFAGKKIPIGNDIIINVNIGHTLYFGLATDICEDIWMPHSPASHHALHGAVILMNISASNETVAKSEYRRLLVASQSGKCIASQIYVSAGPTESTSDVVFGGDAMIYTNGSFKAESKRLSFESQLIYADVDVHSLQRERMITGSFGYAAELDSAEYFYVSAFIGSDSKTKIDYVDPHPFIPTDPKTLNVRCEEIVGIQSVGLAQRLKTVFKDKNPNVYIGISGGLDSTLALLVTIRAYEMLHWDLSGIHAITMPGPGTTSRTLTNALALCKAKGISIKEIPITNHVEEHLRALGHEPCWECLQCENAQARERTQILMDLGFTIGTGDLSEAALGWCTYNGDHMSMYDPNAGVPKTLVKHLVNWIAKQENGEASDVLKDVIATPISPELKKVESKQKTEDELGPYELHDFFLFHMLRNGSTPKKILYLAKIAFKEKYSVEYIVKVMKTFYSKFFANQFKRDAIPNGPKVGSISLSPRGDWRMPSDFDGSAWLEEINEIENE